MDDFHIAGTLNLDPPQIMSRLLSSQLFTLNVLVHEFLYGEKDLSCLTEELTMFQDNVHLWISDEQATSKNKLSRFLLN